MLRCESEFGCVRYERARRFAIWLLFECGTRPPTAFNRKRNANGGGRGRPTPTHSMLGFSLPLIECLIVMVESPSTLTPDPEANEALRSSS